MALRGSVWFIRVLSPAAKFTAPRWILGRRCLSGNRGVGGALLDRPRTAGKTRPAAVPDTDECAQIGVPADRIDAAEYDDPAALLGQVEPKYVVESDRLQTIDYDISSRTC